MLDLYFWTTPNGYKVAILLEELVLQYNVVPNDVSRGNIRMAIYARRFAPTLPSHSVANVPNG